MSEPIEVTPNPFHEAAKEAVDENGLDSSQEVEQLVNEYRDVFESSKDPVVGYYFQLELTDDEPFNCKQYPIPHVFKEDYFKKTDKRDARRWYH